MDKYKCFCCSKKFATEKDILKHLKDKKERGGHEIIENSGRIYCVVDNDCDRQFFTFKGLTRHLKQCVIKV